MPPLHGGGVRPQCALEFALFISLKPRLLKWNPCEKTHKGKGFISLKAKKTKTKTKQLWKLHSVDYVYGILMPFFKLLNHMNCWDFKRLIALLAFWTLTAMDYAMALVLKGEPKCPFFPPINVLTFCDTDIIWPTQRNGVLPLSSHSPWIPWTHARAYSDFLVRHVEQIRWSLLREELAGWLCFFLGEQKDS